MKKSFCNIIEEKNRKEGPLSQRVSDVSDTKLPAYLFPCLLLYHLSLRLKPGGGNCHYPQCMNVPEKLNRNFFVHPECYKKFVYAETLLNKRKSEDKNWSS